MFRKAITALLVTMLLTALPCFTFATETTKATEAATVSIKEIRTDMGNNFVAYPQLEGVADAGVQKKINDDIVLASDIASHFVTLATLKDSPLGLVVEHQSFLAEDIFSTVISAKGKQPKGRDGHKYTALSYDLATGERLTLSDLVTDVNAAVSLMEQLVMDTLTEEISGYMENGELLPLPTSSFTVDRDGVTFYYPAKQFSLLSGYSGACQFYYEELGGLLRTDVKGIPSRIGTLPATYTDAKALIEKVVMEGALPHVPARLGEKMGEIITKYRLIRTPDEFPGGRYYMMEAPAFRQVLLISDAMESGYERSVLEGIQLKRGSLYGLTIGNTKRATWRKLLGEPLETIDFTENMSYDYSLPIGQSDCYQFGIYELRLHANEEGVLQAIQVSK